MRVKKGCLDIPHIKAGRELTHSYTKLVFQSGMTSNFSQEGSLELHCIIYSNVGEKTGIISSFLFSILVTTFVSERGKEMMLSPT